MQIRATSGKRRTAGPPSVLANAAYIKTCSFGLHVLKQLKRVSLLFARPRRFRAYACAVRRVYAECRCHFPDSWTGRDQEQPEWIRVDCPESANSSPSEKAKQRRGVCGYFTRSSLQVECAVCGGAVEASGAAVGGEGSGRQ
ncbi:hypothetical protein SRHO_G00317130 [Serrasalmus rhombeus]